VKIRPLVEAMAKEVSTKESLVMTVATYEGWVENPDQAGSDTFDWAHPNEQGQAKMADKWLRRDEAVVDRIAERFVNGYENGARKIKPRRCRLKAAANGSWAFTPFPRHVSPRTRFSICARSTRRWRARADS
jgi:hypothetical protein